MKHLPLILCALTVAIAGSVVALLSGCEADPSNEGLTVSPASATLSAGESREFTVSGGYEYSWSLKNEGVGSLSTRTGSHTVYTAPSTISTGATQTLQVRSTITGSSTGGSNTTAYGVSGEAVVSFN